MAATLARGDIYRPSARAWGKVVRVGAASLGLGAMMALAAHNRALIEAPLAPFRLGGLGPKEIAVLGLCVAGALAYPALLFAFGGVTPLEARAALKRRRGDAPVTAEAP